jgi:UPF0042 nucleotide-binding protein
MSTRALAVSFGYLHTPPPDADLVVDVRGWVPADPRTAAWCRPLTGADPRVRDVVLAADGAGELLAHIQGAVRALLRVQPCRRAVVALGCSGGRHRSVVIVDELATRLRLTGVSVEVRHEHVDRLVP